MTGNPLVAPIVDQGPGTWTGVWIAEDIELINHGIQNNSWVEGTLGVVGVGLDGLALVYDPVGALLQYGIAWLIEHVKPLSEALDWLAGDPDQIAANAQTWRNVAAALRSEADQLADATDRDLTGWAGAAGSAYHASAQRRQAALAGLAEASGSMALLTEGTGVLIAAVRTLVRDAIATVVSRLAVYAAEAAFSLGTLTPLIVQQATTLIAAWAARISRWLHDLISSIRNLLPTIARLGELIEKLKELLRTLRSGSAAPEPPPPRPEPPPRKPIDPEAEKQRVHGLGFDPAVGKFRQSEADTAVRIENEVGVTLERAPAGSRADWVDGDGRTYDAVGNFPGEYFDRQWPQLQYQITRHLDKADLVPVDVSRFTPDQVALIDQFIAERNLAPRVFLVGQ